jgi:hypothetical protein
MRVFWYGLTDRQTVYAKDIPFFSKALRYGDCFHESIRSEHCIDRRIVRKSTSIEKEKT